LDTYYILIGIDKSKFIESWMCLIQDFLPYFYLYNNSDML